MSLCPKRPSSGFLAAAIFAAAPLYGFACGMGEMELPNPRRLVIHSGERLTPTKERMEEVDAWVREQRDSITLDPSFMIYTESREGPVYPWESLEVNEGGDTATVGVQRISGAGGSGAYLIYAHLHLMVAQGRLDKWLPETEGADPFQLEKAILSRVADVWLYYRSIFDARPYGLLDELIYAKENGFLADYILTARPSEFVEARRERLAENPESPEAYRAWFRRSFQRDPPGLRGSPAGN